MQLFSFKNIHGQNLITNGSFESYTSPIDCGSGGLDNYSTFPVNHVVNNWYGYNSPDYFNSFCSNGPLPSQFGFDVPANIFGYSLAKNSNAYVGISVFQANNLEYKEYLYQQVSSPLQVGKIYCLSFHVSKADRKEYAIKNIGAYFCNSLPSMVSNMYINAMPQVINSNGFISDTTQWTEIQGCFTANGGEQYIIIGNFNSNANTDTLYTGTNNPIANDPPYAYYYIDDITLIDQTTVGLNELSKENSFEIYPNPNNGIFTINSKNEMQKIEVTNVAGQILFSETISSKTHQLQLNHFAQGICFIKINYSNGLSVTKKVVLNP